mmetsp:Transcript_1260/g.2926  ORF Transcript_1260/g.2926 Transcript_1260/m.2926 type:complete len:422 (+) Transcript_1260:98-1363(+)
MLSESLPLSSSTPSTRTCTTCPTSTISATSSTKRFATCEMCTSPCPGVPPSAAPEGAGTSATTPKFRSCLMVPVSHKSEGKSLNADKSLVPPLWPPVAPPLPGCFMEKATLPEAGSQALTRTRTSCPISTKSRTLATMPSLNSVTWTRPVIGAPSPDGCVTSTKAPKSATPSTFPSNHWSPPTRSAKRAASSAEGGAFLIPGMASGLSSFMLRKSLWSSSCTLVTRTLTSWPTSSSLRASLTNPSLICDMCRKPRASSSPPAGPRTATNPPIWATDKTLPVNHSSARPAISWNWPRSASNGPSSLSSSLPSDSEPATSSGSIIEKAARPADSSTERTRTRTLVPIGSSCSTEPRKKPALTSFLWTKPCTSSVPSAPGGTTDTKAPQGWHRATVPSSQAPGPSAPTNGSKRLMGARFATEGA